MIIFYSFCLFLGFACVYKWLDQKSVCCGVSTGKCVMLAGWILLALCWHLYWLICEKYVEDQTQSVKKSNISWRLSAGLHKQPLLSNWNLIIMSVDDNAAEDVSMCMWERKRDTAGLPCVDKNRWVPKDFRHFQLTHHNITTALTSLQSVMLMVQGWCNTCIK